MTEDLKEPELLRERREILEALAMETGEIAPVDSRQPLEVEQPSAQAKQTLVTDNQPDSVSQDKRYLKVSPGADERSDSTETIRAEASPPPAKPTSVRSSLAGAEGGVEPRGNHERIPGRNRSLLAARK